jgi:hypothetical protein
MKSTCKALAIGTGLGGAVAACHDSTTRRRERRVDAGLALDRRRLGAAQRRAAGCELHRGPRTAI